MDASDPSSRSDKDDILQKALERSGLPLASYASQPPGNFAVKLFFYITTEQALIDLHPSGQPRSSSDQERVMLTTLVDRANPSMPL